MDVPMRVIPCCIQKARYIALGIGYLDSRGTPGGRLPILQSSVLHQTSASRQLERIQNLFWCCSLVRVILAIYQEYN